MAKLKNRKPLQKYQTGGDTNDPWGFQGSGLLNPFNYDITKGLTGVGTLDVMKPGQNFINFGDNPFGQQIGESSVKTANMLQGLFPTDPLPAGADTYNKLQRQIAKEQDLVLKDGQWRSAKTGEKVYSSKEMNNLINLREAQENQKREENKKLAPLATPLVMLNELGEAQKKSYAQAQKESMYDVTKSPLSMESKGFFAKEGMRTPPVTEVYRMMGAHQGLPETSYKLAKTLDFKSAKQKDLNDLLEQIVMEEGGNVGYSNIPKAQEGLSSKISEIARANVDKQKIKNKKLIEEGTPEYTGDFLSSLMGLNPIGGLISSAVMAADNKPVSDVLLNLVPFYKLAKSVNTGKNIGNYFLKSTGAGMDISDVSNTIIPPVSNQEAEVPISGGILPEIVIKAPRRKIELILDRQQGGNVTSVVNEIENLQKIQNNMYNNNQRISRLAMMLGGGLIRGYQEGGMQQPMSPEEEQMMMEQAMQQEMAMQQGQQQPMPQQGGGMEGQPQQPQPQPGENKYMQLPPEQQVEVYKQIIDFVMENGIDTLEQQYPEEYQFFEEFSDKLEGEDMEEEGGEGEEEEGGSKMETEAGRMEMGGGEEETESEYPTDEEEVPVGARPGENAMRPAQPMEGAEQMKEGGIPQRYRNMGFTKVGQKRQSDRPGKKWQVLAKKGDKYKVVHGGAKGMEDFKQHGSKDRQKRFWDRMGGKDSAKANDPFSPLYWHKRFGTW